MLDVAFSRKVIAHESHRSRHRRGKWRGAALALLNDGDIVVMVGRRPDALAETAGLTQGGNAICMPADVTDPDAVAVLFETVRDRFGRLDLLFNNAGSSAPATNFGDLDFATWRRVVSINIDAMFLVANHAFRVMRDQRPQGGRIINTGSLSAYSPRPGSAPYTTSKHAVTGLTKSIALDGRGYGIACGQIDIGNAATPMTARMAGGVPQADGRIMPEPVMDAAAVGRSVLLMASMPADTNIATLTVMATTMPFVGRG